MGKKIIIAGAGHAAMMCGATLAKNGYDVTVYERRKRKDVGYPWFDCVNPDIFEMVGAPTPEEAGIEWAWRNDITFYGPNTDDDHKIFQHLNFPEDTEIIIDRFKLYDLMIDYAEKCGVKFEYGVNIKGPIVKKNRIVGIKTSKGDKKGDLVIDGCGCNSVLRNNLPDYWGIQKNPPRGDIIYLYRAYFDCPVDPDTVEDKYKCIFLPSDTDFNFCWTDVVKDFDGFDKFTDVLIADIDPMTPAEAERRAEDYRKKIPELGKTRLKGGQVTPLTIREPLSNLVADGYVAIGDSAHMSMAVNGSGLSIGFEVSQFLAETIMADKKGEFTAKTLYPFAYKFWKKKGILCLRQGHPDLARDDHHRGPAQHLPVPALGLGPAKTRRGTLLEPGPSEDRRRRPRRCPRHLRPRRPPAEEVQPPQGHQVGQTLRLALPAQTSESIRRYLNGEI